MAIFYKFALYTLYAFFVLPLWSCSRPEAEKKTANFKIHFPGVAAFSTSQKISLGKPTALAIIDYANLCFAVNMKPNGLGKNQKNGTSIASCSIDDGLVVGTVAPGQSLSVTMPGSATIDVDVYGFLRKSSTDPCPTISGGGPWSWPINQTYLLGSSHGVLVKFPDTQIDISVSLPTADQNLALTQAWPAQCLAGLQPVIPLPSNSSRIGRVLAGATLSAGTKVRLYSRVGVSSTSKSLLGATVQLKSLVKPQ